MATKDNTSGLLSKVAKFVRNPTTNWSDLDSQVPEADSGYSKQALKEMIERKRQNDFVRKREFDQLRKLRSRDPAVSLEVAGRPSFFQTSIPSNLDERAVTLKKIDEIEAQMSKQWWKGKQVEGTEKSPNFPMASVSTSEAGADFALTQPSAMVGDDAPERAGFPSTRMAAGGISENGKSAASDGNGGGFSTSKLFAVELSDDNTDPDLEEAAIRFANGDDLSAENGLLDALQDNGSSTEQAEIWTRALFDFYRATGQQNRFEDLALDFAQVSGRSAPAWFSMPEQAGIKTAATAIAPVAPVAEVPALNAIWQCPHRLDPLGMGELHLALASAPLPWSLNWSQIQEIDIGALQSLEQLFANWCTQRVSLHFDAVDKLDKILRLQTPSGVQSVSTLWWRLRMDLLRIMRLQDEFELVALDYCVTYEVSPPSWHEARCTYVRGSNSVAVVPVAVTVPGPVGPGLATQAAELRQALTAPMGLEDIPVVVVELVGEIAGDAAEALLRLEAGRHQGAGRLVISCAKLIRVDFSAAGSILNWVASREEEGCNVQFREVHRLVGAFFNVIGINEHARVVLRAN